MDGIYMIRTELRIVTHEKGGEDAAIVMLINDRCPGEPIFIHDDKAREFMKALGDLIERVAT